ncbi:tape measure protein [Bartonella tamiae]|uniref:Tape measure domain-containing protein n=1 Tax=Bartonella tamiae Th239 TaxID=1094558 RepID=J0QZT2_9HYPH|nr:tape measure protein [Bartonella tamiae]EJF91686.1 tape measure domain-containing protein [Bartonella tamiae Th239]
MSQTDDARLAVLLEARLNDFERSLNRAQKTFASRASSMEKTAERTRKKIEGTFSGLGNNLLSTVSRFALPIIGIGSIAGLTKYADTWSDLNARLANSTGSTEAAAATMQRLSDVADRTYSSLETTVNSFIENSRALKDLGLNTKQQLDYTEALNNALVVSAARGERARAVQNALSKAMAAGRLSGQNLNTVIQSGGRVAEVLADEMGVTVSQLAVLGRQGKITGDVIFSALIKNMAKLREEAENMPSTIEDGFQRLGNALLKFVGSLDQATGITGAVANGLIFISENMGAIATGAAAAAVVLLSTNTAYISSLKRVIATQVAAIATNPYLLIAAAIGTAVTALVAFSDEIKPIKGEMGTLSDYSAVIWDDIKTQVGEAWKVISDLTHKLIDMITQGLEGMGLSWEDVMKGIKKYYNTIIGLFLGMAKGFITTFTKLPQAIADGVISSMNRMIQLVEDGLNSIIRATNKAISAINNISGVVGVEVGVIAEINLQKLENRFAGAGRRAAEAYQDAFNQLNRDFIGDSDWIDHTRRRANERAEARNKKLEEEQAKASLSKNSSGGQSTISDLDKEIAKIKEHTKALQDQAKIQAQIDPLANDYEYTLTKLTTIQQLYNAATKAGLTVTPEMAQSFEVLAEKAAQAEVEVNKIKAAQDELVKKIAEVKDISRDMTRTFIDGMIDGKSATEALGDAVLRLGQRLLDAGLDSIFDTIFQSAGGRKGGGFLSGILGFDKGGYTGDGGKYQPAGIVHKGEVVWSQSDVKKWGGARAVDAMRRGYAHGGIAGMPSRMAIPNIPSPSFLRTMSQDTQRAIKVDVTPSPYFDVKVSEISDQRIRSAAPTIINQSVSQSDRKFAQNYQDSLDRSIL